MFLKFFTSSKLDNSHFIDKQLDPMFYKFLSRNTKQIKIGNVTFGNGRSENLDELIRSHKKFKWSQSTISSPLRVIYRRVVLAISYREQLWSVTAFEKVGQ